MQNLREISGTIFNIQKFSINDGPGIRTTVFFKGCPLNCLWCQNPESKNPDTETDMNQHQKGYRNIFCDRYSIGSVVTVSDVMDEVIKDYIFYEESGGGVTFSGGEPMLQPDFLLELLIKCSHKGIHTSVDTSGFAPKNDFKRIRNYADLFLFDLKIMDDETHIKYTGVSNKLIHENLVDLSRNNNNIIIRIPLIPGITDTELNLKEIIEFLVDLKTIRKVSLLPYNEFSESKYKRFNIDYTLGKLEVQSDEKLSYFSNMFKSNGFEVKIRG